MLCRRTIELFKDAPRLSCSLIPREELANWKQADHLLKNASAQAEQLLSLTKKKCEALHEETSLEIWQRANAQLKRWERDRQAMCDKLEQYANSVTNEAIRHLLDETVASSRLTALLKQLLAIQVPEVSATLLCNSHDFEQIKKYLASYTTTAWKLHADETIASQTLILKTDEGDFRISWSSMLGTFFKQGEAFRIDV
ncbi:type III secretion system stator protein SctL [Pseudomonas fluorescens]|uniref:HrpE/YscL family type III secretion apparatus protein n=1 Tax=Pseudomonas fluorescens TaxID=294 RepID=A0A7Z6QPT4_PSEFL|nr:type III secretion system stator protein SctL [Pseudomonas fluorescens]RDS91056.1 HrpE/YscL family type III secretion apparatus protein [Pseudomonas fluorescens]